MYSANKDSGGSPEMYKQNRDQFCQAINEKTGDICAETESLRILDEFRMIYEARIKKVDEETEESSNIDPISTKLQIMTEWVKDLGEQNVMLVRTIEELERAACDRVIVLKEKLEQSFDTVTENMTRAYESEETLNILANRVSQLEKDEENLQQKIEFLQSDIRGLLELIRRARRENNWNLDGITFFEIQSSDIPLSLECSCGQVVPCANADKKEKEDTESVENLKLQLEQLQENKKKDLAYQAELEEKLADLNEKVLLKEDTIKKYISKLQNLRDTLRKRSKLANQVIVGSIDANADPDSDIITIVDIVESALVAKDIEVESFQRKLEDTETNLKNLMHEKNDEMNSLQIQLEEKYKEHQETEYRLTCLQKEAAETCEALTAEVAEKHDQTISLRKDVSVLEEQCRQANIQTHFKDDIIKEMRRELKQARVKDTCSSRRVRIMSETSQKKCSFSHSDTSCSSFKSGGVSLQDQLHEVQSQLKIAKHTLALKIDEINKLKRKLTCQTNKSMELSKIVEKLNVSKLPTEKEDESLNDTCNQHQDNVITYLSNTKVLMEKEKEALFELRTELEKVLEELSIKEKKACERDNDMADIHEKLQDIEKLLQNYKTQVIDHAKSTESMISCTEETETKLTSLQNIFQNSSNNSDNETALQYIKSLLTDLRRIKIEKDTFQKQSNALLNYCLEDITNNVKSILQIVRKYTCSSQIQLQTKNMSRKLTRNVQNILKICREKEKAIILIDRMTQKCKETHSSDCHEPASVTNVDILQQFYNMEEFRICTVEAQAATEDLREEISNVIATFNCRHEKYTELNKMVNQVQDHLAKTRESLSEAINQLDLQELDRVRHDERIANEEIRLKTVKNEINQITSNLCRCIGNTQENIQETNLLEFTKVTCNGSLNMIVEQVEQIVCNLQMHRLQECNAVSLLTELKAQINTMGHSLKDLQRRTNEVLVENEIMQKTFCEKAKKLDRLEDELDCAHTKMQNILECFTSTEEQISSQFDRSQDNFIQNQRVEEILKAKESLHKVTKECEDLRIKMTQEVCQREHDERLNECKCQVTDLQDQIRILQNEAECKVVANNFLKHTIESMRKELSAMQAKAETHRQSCSSDNMESKRKIFTLEQMIKTQKDVENNLRESLESSEIELKRSKELLDSFHNGSNAEGTPSKFGCQPKYENIPQSFKILQDTIYSTRNDLQELGNELKKLVSEESSHSCSSTVSVIAAIDTLRKYGENMEHCSCEIQKLMKALCYKDKLLENKDEIITIQKDSIEMTQAELKDLHQKLQEKIDVQSNIIFEYEKEKNHLLKQNELQIQTIRNLQSAVVEAKRRLDQMGNKTMNELLQKDEVICALTLYLTETQNQYNQCFTEAAKQDTVLELQRDAIESLQKKISCMEFDKYLIATLLHFIYHSILTRIQEQMQPRANDFELLKSKMDNLIKSKNCLEDKYVRIKKLWEEADQELQELKRTLLEKENKIKNHQTEIMQNRKADVKDKEYIAQELMTRLPSKDNSTSTELILKHASTDSSTLTELILNIVSKDSSTLTELISKFAFKDSSVLTELVSKLALKNSSSSTETISKLFSKDNSTASKLIYKDSSTLTEVEQFEMEVRDCECQTTEDDSLPKVLSCVEKDLQVQIKVSSEENEDLKKQLQKYKLDFEILDEELKTERKNSIGAQELKVELEKQLTQSSTEQRKNIEDSKKIYDDLKDELRTLQLEDKNKEIKLMKCTETVGRLHDDIDMKNEEIRRLTEQIACCVTVKKEQTEMVQQLEEKLLSSEQQTEECLCELNASKKILCILRARICSLKGLLKEKLNDMAKLQADHQVLKNANSILKTENDLIENKARDDICDLKKRLKEVQFQLCLMEDNYHRVTQDFNKSQELLVMAAKREVELQQALTTTEKNFLSKLAIAEREEARLGDIVDKLGEELEDTRDELSSKNAELYQAQNTCKSYANELETARQDIQLLKEKIITLEGAKCCLSQELQKYMDENCDLSKQKSFLEQDNYKYMSELEDMHKSLLVLRKECQLKTKSLACISAELTQAAASRSELCNESQYVVSCIHTWMEEQKRLIETLTSKLKLKQQQFVQFGFEKKALLVMVRELRRANCILTQRLKRSHKCTVSRGLICAGCCVPHRCIPYCSNMRLGSNTNYPHLFKKCSVGPIRPARRTSVCNNNWWFPKMEHLTKELRKNNQWWIKKVNNEDESDPGLDESRDCGYQSSASK